MKVKFSKFERIAGFFVLSAFVGALALGVGVAIERGWLSSKVQFQTVLENAEGINAGTLVKIAGLRAGSVYEIELVESDEVLVKFEILEKFHKQVREDSHVLILRPFVIGDKVIDITVGSKEKEMIKPGSLIVAEKTYDVMDIMSGRKLGPFIENLENTMDNLKILVDAFTERKRIDSLVRIFDNMEPLVKNLNRAATGFVPVAHALNRKKNLLKTMENFKVLTYEIASMMPEFKKEVPHMGQQMGQLINDMSILAREFKQLTPAITEVAPELPRASKKAVEALDEAVITLKALQDSFFFSSGAKKARAEELDKMKEEREKLAEERKALIEEREKLELLQKSQRLPASESKTDEEEP